MADWLALLQATATPPAPHESVFTLGKELIGLVSLLGGGTVVAGLKWVHAQYKATAAKWAYVMETLSEVASEVALGTAMRRSLDTRAVWEGVVRADGTTECVYVSPAWTELTGQNREESDNGGWIKCVAEEDKARVSAAADYAALHGYAFDQTYTCVRLKNGHRTRVHHTGDPIRSTSGNKVVGWKGLLVPIS